MSQLPPDFQPITPQRVFDAAWQAFIVEDRQPATESSHYCSYLTLDGKKCAVGLLIPEGHPAQKSSEGVIGVIYEYPELFHFWGMRQSDESLNQIRVLQKLLHDHIQSDGRWNESVEFRRNLYLSVAKRHGLRIPT